MPATGRRHRLNVQAGSLLDLVGKNLDRSHIPSICVLDFVSSARLLEKVGYRMKTSRQPLTCWKPRPPCGRPKPGSSCWSPGSTGRRDLACGGRGCAVCRRKRKCKMEKKSWAAGRSAALCRSSAVRLSDGQTLWAVLQGCDVMYKSRGVLVSFVMRNHAVDSSRVGRKVSD